MQTYNYKCNDCGKSFEVKATLKEKESKTFSCPHCKSENTKSKFSMTNFVKNIFDSDQAGGCCSGGEVCDISCKPDEENPSGCSDKNASGSCCG